MPKCSGCLKAFKKFRRSPARSLTLAPTSTPSPRQSNVASSSIILTTSARCGAANLESAGRRANYSISVRLSAIPFAGLAVQTRALTKQAFRRARPCRYKSSRYCKAKRNARLIISITLQAGPGLSAVCPTSPKRTEEAVG